MRVLMLGWEYPPHISGGLGTACEGLTRAISRLGGHQITFVVPYLYGGENAPHMMLIDAADAEGAARAGEWGQSAEIKTVRVPAMLMPYWDDDDYDEYRAKRSGVRRGKRLGSLVRLRRKYSKKSQYGANIFQEVSRFSACVVKLADLIEFDVIHAHDWMTYPAGVALARLTGKPLVVHVHSLEYDRSGIHFNQRIHRIEQLGIRAATAVIAVSHYTKSIICKVHGVPAEKVFVVHNGIYPKGALSHYTKRKNPDAKVVLFLGRITFQKGPDFLVEAAAKVVPHVPEAKFVVAGTGDMLPRIVARVHELGIQDRFVFPGFLREREVERIFSIADLYVMPSVSEPFGLSALEAINFDTPALVSRQSGVAEVVDHALKFDYWDVTRFADLMINSLQHDELRADMVAMAKKELHKLRWDQAAQKTVGVYQHAAA